MATITQSEVQIWTGTGGSGQQVGNTIVTIGASTTVTADSTTLGVALSPGTQYSAKARCTNSESYTSDWTNFYNFKTLAVASFNNQGANGTTIYADGEVETTSAVEVEECGFYYSTSQSMSNPIKVGVSVRTFEQDGASVSGLQENTTYYIVPFCIDSDGREWRGDYSTYGEAITTGYNAATVLVSNTSTTYNSISGTASITSTSLVTAATVTITPTGGGTSYTKNLSTSSTSQLFSFTDGDTDAQGSTVSISPSTEYRITVSATNSAGSATGTAVVTTQAQAVSSIAITGITNITPYSATVNLSFGD